MSQGEAMPRAVALAAAEKVRAWLASSCERIEIAGSLRRGKPEVRDIELVAVPRWEAREEGDLWGSSAPIDLLEERLRLLFHDAALAPREVATHRANGTVEYQQKLGPAFKALTVDGIPLDLFTVRPPATWGCIFALRTGPGDWNTKLVTECQTIGRKVAGGQALAWVAASDTWRAVDTPEEADFFRALGQPWVEPRDRRPEAVRISREVAA